MFKNNLSSAQYEELGKDQLTELLLCFFLGGLGVHKFYMKNTGIGVLYLFTVGLFGIGTLVDFIQLLINYINRDKNTATDTCPATDGNGANTELKNIEALKEFKELFDAGVLTEEEYNEQKSRLLNL